MLINSGPQTIALPGAFKTNVCLWRRYIDVDACCISERECSMNHHIVAWMESFWPVAVHIEILALPWTHQQTMASTCDESAQEGFPPSDWSPSLC
jgi:hypothetical protein